MLIVSSIFFFVLFVGHQVASWYSSNQNGGLQSPEKAYFVLWINEKSRRMFFGSDFIQKSHRKEAKVWPNCLCREVSCVRNKEKVVKESVWIDHPTTFYKFSWQATEILACINWGLQFNQPAFKNALLKRFSFKAAGRKFFNFLNKTLNLTGKFFVAVCYSVWDCTTSSRQPFFAMENWTKPILVYGNERNSEYLK